MKQFLSGQALEDQVNRLDRIERQVDKFTDMLDWKDGVSKRDVVQLADHIIKLVKKAKKTWVNGGFTDRFYLVHDAPDEEPPFAGPTGQPIPETELTAEFRIATIVRPKTKQLDMKKLMKRGKK